MNIQTKHLILCLTLLTLMACGSAVDENSQNSMTFQLNSSGDLIEIMAEDETGLSPDTITNAVDRRDLVDPTAEIIFLDELDGSTDILPVNTVVRCCSLPDGNGCHVIVPQGCLSCYAMCNPRGPWYIPSSK